MAADDKCWTYPSAASLSLHDCLCGPRAPHTRWPSAIPARPLLRRADRRSSNLQSLATTHLRKSRSGGAATTCGERATCSLPRSRHLCTWWAWYARRCANIAHFPRTPDTVPRCATTDLSPPAARAYAHLAGVDAHLLLGQAPLLRALRVRFEDLTIYSRGLAKEAIRAPTATRRPSHGRSG